MADKKKFGDTKFGKWLNNRLLPEVPDLAKGLITLNPTEIIKSVADIVLGENTTVSKDVSEEFLKYQMEWEKEMAILEKEIFGLEIQDKDSARNREIQVVNSTGSWITKNLVSVLALSILVICFVYFILVTFVPNVITYDNKDIIIYILGALTTQVMNVIGYYFGATFNQNNDATTSVPVQRWNK